MSRRARPTVLAPRFTGVLVLIVSSAAAVYHCTHYTPQASVPRFWGLRPNRGVFSYVGAVPARPSQAYDKPPLNEAQLLKQLVDRGLLVPDRDRAARYLRHIGYYRLSPYMRPLQDNGTDHRFRKGTQFDDVLHLYVFDRSLRLLVMDALERVEVAVRAAISNAMSLKDKDKDKGDAFWYLDPQNFDGEIHFGETLAVIARETRQQKQRSQRKTQEHTDGLHFPDALTHYVSTYSTPETPPSWVSIELLTLGNLLHLYRALPQTYRKQIAQQLGLQDPVLESWLASYVRVRNICAHHGRLWNRFLGAYPMIPTSKQIRWLEDRSVLSPSDPNAIEHKRLYPVLVSLQTILYTISPHSTWTSRLRDLLRQSPFVPLTALGMTEGWDEDPFWTEALGAAQP